MPRSNLRTKGRLNKALPFVGPTSAWVSVGAAAAQGWAGAAIGLTIVATLATIGYGIRVFIEAATALRIWYADL